MKQRSIGATALLLALTIACGLLWGRWSSQQAGPPEVAATAPQPTMIPKGQIASHYIEDQIAPRMAELAREEAAAKAARDAQASQAQKAAEQRSTAALKLQEDAAAEKARRIKEKVEYRVAHAQPASSMQLTIPVGTTKQVWPLEGEQ